MINLNGILAYSMDNFLCLRGYAKINDLCRASQIDADIQRELMADHKNDIVNFLREGTTRFFPEVILSITLDDGTTNGKAGEFFTAMAANTPWSGSRVGAFRINVKRHNTKSQNKLASISFDENVCKLNRIDGNHRLSAGEALNHVDFTIPFCLILFPSKDEEANSSRLLFHYINAKQRPLQLEENLKIIIDGTTAFPDTKLRATLGHEFYLARKTIKEIQWDYIPQIKEYLENAKYSFFVDLYRYLLNQQQIQPDEDAISTVKRKLSEIDRALEESMIATTTTNVSVLGALAFYKITDVKKYEAFLLWVKKNNGSMQKFVGYWIPDVSPA